MERNDDLMNSSSTSGLGGLDDASTTSFGATGATGGTLADDATLSGSAQSAKSTAADKFGQVRSAAADKLGVLKEKASNLNLKEKASTLNANLADRLEAGANKLRQSGQGATGGDLAAGTAGTAGAGSLSLSGNPQLANLGSKAADALQGTATFLREGDIKASLEQQVRANPARTLLVAVGLGYVLGKALRGSNR